MLVRLWESEEPRAVFVGWDTLTVPTYRHEALEGYQSGRVFDKSLLEQLDMLPELVRSLGFAAAKEDGFEADDFLGAAVRFEGEARRDGGRRHPAVDSFQLASQQTTIVTRRCAASPSSRASGPRRSASGTASSPLRFLTSSRSAATRPTRSRAPRASGRRRPRRSKQYGLDAALDAGRFPNLREELELYRRIATLDASAPIPPLKDQSPTWAEASSLLDSWGLGNLAGRIAARSA